MLSLFLPFCVVMCLNQENPFLSKNQKRGGVAKIHVRENIEAHHIMNLKYLLSCRVFSSIGLIQRSDVTQKRRQASKKNKFHLIFGE